VTSTTDPTRRGIDTQGMFDATASMPEQVEAAIEAGASVEGLPEGEGIANIVVLGMGGSGIAGDLLAAVGQQFLPVPVVVAKGYDAPSFIDPTTLVIALSFSGNTEETLQAADEAQTSGGRIVAISRADGQLAERALDWGAPHIPIPEDIPQPRAGLGALAIPPLVVLERLGLFPGADEWARAAVTQLRRRRDQLVADANPAAELARRLGRSLPIVYGGSATGAVAAARWKTQVNENAKVPAFANAMPELCHNEVCGWGQHGDLTRQVFQVVMLRHDEEHPQEARRFALVAAVMDEVVGAIHSVQAEGDGSLAQLLDLVLFGDFVSLHLAAQEGLDPGPVPVLDEIKAALAHG
jgi:glucose/mannose-6-phosphate isomerase